VTEPGDETADKGDDQADEAEELDTPSTGQAAYGCPVTYSVGQRVLHVPRDDWGETAAALLADGWEMCVDVTAVDYLSYGAGRELPPTVVPERFEVVASFVSHRRRDRLRARAQVPESDPSIESLYPIYPGTDFLEREVFDLFGIAFEGHPDLSRILMPETWEGHPLRKDYAVGTVPVQFKAPAQRETRGSAPAQRETRGSAPAQRETRGSAPAQRETRGSAPAQRELRE